MKDVRTKKKNKGKISKINIENKEKTKRKKSRQEKLNGNTPVGDTDEGRLT